MTKTLGDFVGIPYKKGGDSRAGADCWGVVLMALEGVHGIKVDEQRGCTAEGAELAHVIAETASGANWQRVDEPEDGDVVVMVSRHSMRPEHVGLYGGGKVLHSMRPRPDCASAIHPLKFLKRYFHRLEFYRYAAR